MIANQGVTLTGEQLTLGGTIGAGNALDIQGKQVSQSGALVSGQAMTIKADDLSLTGQVQGQSVLLTSDRGSQHGRLLASDNLVWQSKQLEGNGWMQAGADLTLSGNALTHKGTALAQGRMALDFAELSSQGGLFARDMALTGSRLTLQGTLETTRGAQLQADTLQLGGGSRIGTDLTLGATLLSLSGTQQVGGALRLEAKDADLGGELEVGADLNVKAETLRSAGKVLAKQADIDAGQWDQRGSLATDGALVWRGTRLTQQDKGVLQAGGKLSLAGDAVTLAGTVAAKGNVGITADNYVQLGTLNTVQGLSIDADQLQLGGSTQARTAALQSREGQSSGQHLIADSFTWQSDLLTNKGWLQAGKDLTLTTRSLDNDGTLIAGGKHSIEAKDRLTNQGSLAGNQLSLISKELQNSGLLQGKQGVELSAERAILTGRLTSQGAVQLGANLLALGGNADIGGSLTLKGDEQQLAGNWRVGALLHSTGKQLTLDGDWQASQWQLLADSLVNKGRLASEQAASLNVGEMHNQQGATLVAGGPLTLVGKSLVQEGSWLGAGDQSIKVDDVQQHGQWVGDGALKMEGTQFNNSGALRAASMGLAFGELTNRGRMESLEEFGWEGKQWHNLGALIAGRATLSGQHLINSGDVGVHQLTMVATDRLENNGVLVGKDHINLNAATLDSQGDMLSSGELTLGADSLALGGLTQAKKQLTLTAGQATLAGNVVADRLQWGGQHLIMGGTTVAREAELSGNQISLEGSLKGDRQTLEASTLTTGKTSSLLAKEKQQLKADQMTLQGSIVAGLQQEILATALTQQGVLASGGGLALQVADTLHNEGKISSETLTLEAGHIDNGGALVSKGALALKTGDLINRGHWQADQGITLTATRLLNSGHWISGLAQSLTLDALDNSGTLQSGSAMTLTAQHLNSRGKLLANQDMSLTADEIILENGSTTASNGRLALKGADVSSAGMLSAADDLSWQGQRFNHSGTTVTDSALRLEGEALTLDGTLQGGAVALDTSSLTTGGSLNSQGNLVVNARGAVQHDGQWQGGNLVLNSASWQGAGTLGSNGTLTLRTGQLQQQGPWRILGATDIQADTVTLNGSLISGGDLTLLSRGDLSSKTGSQLVSGGNLSVEGKQLTQQGLWQSERAMQIKGSRVEQQGDLLAGTDLGLRSGSWQQNGKTRASGTLNAAFTEDSVLAGTVQADGGILLSAPSLTLKGTLASKGNVNLTTTSQLSQLGNLLSGGELTLGAARIDQQGRIEAGTLQSRGELQNDGIMLVVGQGSLSGARLDNRGTLQGDGLTITNAQLDNRGALLANNLTITNAEVLNRGRVQGGSVRLETQSLDNQLGAVLRAQNQGDISAVTLSNAGELSSGNSLLLKGNQLSNAGLVSANWLEASPLARLVNTGTLFGQQLTLHSADIYAPGKILAGQKATLEAGQATGIGEWLSGGDLSLKVGSSLSSQGTLSAKGTLDVRVQGDWTHVNEWGSGNKFIINISGNMYNKGMLGSNGSVNVAVNNLSQTGSIVGGGKVGIKSNGNVENKGAIVGTILSINSKSIDNYSTLISDSTMVLHSERLTNDRGEISSQDNIFIGSVVVVNDGGRIESVGGNIEIVGERFTNKSNAISVVRNEVKPTHNLNIGSSSLYIPVDYNDLVIESRNIPYVSYKKVAVPKNKEDIILNGNASELVVNAGERGVVVSGKDIKIKSNQVVNEIGDIVSGRDIYMESSQINNIGYTSGISRETFVYKLKDDALPQLSDFYNTGVYVYKDPETGVLYGVKDNKTKFLYTLVNTSSSYAEGTVHTSNISASHGLYGNVSGILNNNGVKVDGRDDISRPQYINNNGSAFTPPSPSNLQFISHVLKPVGPDNGVPMPDFQLPSGDKGLFAINDSGDSPYLIEVNPLLANLGQSGNGMMDRIDAALQQQLQGSGQLSFDSISGNGGITQANGQNANWSLPGRVIGEAASPDFQDLNGVKPVNNGHATVSQQWQQSLQQGFGPTEQGPQVGAGATGASDQWQQSLQQGFSPTGQGPQIAGGSSGATDLWQQSLQQGFSPTGQEPQIAGGSSGVTNQWQHSLQQSFNPSGQGPHISGGHSGSAGQWQQSLQDGFTHEGGGQQVTGGGGQVAGQWQQSLQNGWQGQPVSGVTVVAPGAAQISSQPTPAVVTAPVVETSPVLTQVDQFLGSNYFFDQVNFTPEKDIKLLGDAAFDTRVIRDAVLAQTGRRFINNEMGSDLAQMKALIDNAAKNQRELGLSPGVALSAEQVAQLGHSMVWWEPVWYQGKIVLAPKLYLTEADKRHLSGSVITAANIDLTAGGINNSGTLLADGTLSLKSGSTLVNQGQIQAGGRLELIAKGDILNQNLIKGGNVAIASLDGSVRNETQTSQRHVDVNGVLSSELTDQTRFSRTDVGDIARIESTGNLLLQAGQDISLSASNLLAGLDMSLSAGRDITIGSLEDRSKWEEGQNSFTRVEQLMSSLDAGRSLALSADRDLIISATSLTAKGDALLQAGNELSLKTADNQASLHTTRRNGYDIERQSEEVGVNLTANNIALRSGGDLSLRAASVQATEQLSATAGRDLLVESGETTDYRESYTKETKKKAFSKKTSTTHDIVEQHAAQASDLGGQYVLLKAQQDMDIKGSNVVGDLGATLLAGRDMNISAVDLLSREMHFSETKRSGLMGSGGLGVTIGKQQQSSDMMGATLAKEGSSVGSVQGNVTLQAGDQLVVAGSDVIAGKDILMTGKDVAILSEQQIITRKEEFKSQQSGLTLALTGGAVTAVQAAYDLAKTSKESSNDRLVALQGTKAAMSGYQAWEALQSSSGGPGGVPDASFVGIAISVGNQRSHSSSQSSESNAFTSEVNAGGDVTIVAKGDAANTSGDLLMTGSSVKGQNVTLGAARDLVLQSAVNSSDSKGSNHSSGWNVGLSIGVSQGSFGISIFANMNAAKGKENGDSDRYTETNITAGNVLTLTSGRDATLLGAMVSGDKVNADIGRNLTLTSQQDNDHYQSKQSSIAAGGSFTFGSMSGSGYINASRQKINSDFESVVEQTGVFAGKQGFDIRVGEHTQLNGAVLAGSEDDSKNRLSTGTLGWNDLVNRADYKVESQSIGISSSGGSKEEGFSGKGAMTAAAMLGGGNSSGSASSTTHASISAGQIEIRNEEAQQQDLVTLHRDPTQAANGLSPIFDKQKELERMQEARMIGEVGQQATQLVVTKYLGEANEKAKEDPKYAQSKEYKDLQAKWGVGSDFQRGMQAATAALQGLAGGDIAQAAAGAAAPYLAQLIKQQTPEGPSRVMAHALVQGALAAAQNKNAMVSATGAATGELVGMLATELYHKDASQLTEGEKETVSTLATLAAGLAGGLTGADGTDVLAGAQTGKTVVENNSLSDGWHNMLQPGIMSYGQSVASYVKYVQDNNLPPEQVYAGLTQMVKGDAPEGTDIIRAILSNNPGSDTIMAILSAEDAKDYALALLTSIPAEKALSLVSKTAKVIDNKILIRAAEKISTAKKGQSTQPRDLNEQVLWNNIKESPSGGVKFSDMGLDLNGDVRFPKSAGFEKMTMSHELPNGKKIEVHYQYNTVTGKAYDMKIVSPQRTTTNPTDIINNIKDVVK
ncbi:hemagglutinin repeat-containing protein [Aeromonas tecta]